MRKYEVIWQKLKQADAEQWVVVRISSAEQMQSVINMVQKEKTLAQVSRKRLDLPAFGKLEIKREPELKRVSFRLINSGDLL